MVALDTDVLLLAFAFHRDERQANNSHCLALAQEHEPVVAIYSVMELLGQLSFNLSQERLRQWPSWLQDRYRLTILYPPLDGLDATTFFAAEFIERPLHKMQQRMPFLDALILNLVEDAPDLEAFVTWNARHFAGKIAAPVLTPIQFIDRAASSRR